MPLRRNGVVASLMHRGIHELGARRRRGGAAPYQKLNNQVAESATPSILPIIPPLLPHTLKKMPGATMPKAKTRRAKSSLAIIHPLTPTSEDASSKPPRPRTRAATKRKLDDASDARGANDAPPAPKRARKSAKSSSRRKGTTRAPKNVATTPTGGTESPGSPEPPNDTKGCRCGILELQFILPFEDTSPPSSLGGVPFVTIDPLILKGFNLNPEDLPALPGLLLDMDREAEKTFRSNLTEHLRRSRAPYVSPMECLHVRQGTLDPCLFVTLLLAAPHLKKLILEDVTLTGSPSDITSAMEELGLKRRSLEDLVVTYNPSRISDDFFRKLLTPFTRVPVKHFVANYVGRDPPTVLHASLRLETGSPDWFQGTLVGQGPWPMDAILEGLENSPHPRKRITHLRIDGPYGLDGQQADISRLLKRLGPVRGTLECLHMGGDMMRKMRPVEFHHTFLRGCSALQEIGIHLPVESWKPEHRIKSLWDGAVEFLQILRGNPSVPRTLRRIRVIIRSALETPPIAVPIGAQILTTDMLNNLARALRKLLEVEDSRWDVIVDVPREWRTFGLVNPTEQALFHDLFRFDVRDDRCWTYDSHFAESDLALY